MMSRKTLWPIAAGVCLIVFGGYLRILSLRSRTWPVTSGVITDSRWRTRTSGGHEEKTSADIRYRYTVGGQIYRGDVISYGDMLFASDSDRLQRYPQGATVEVHYDPRDPGLAVLESGAGPAPGLFILAGLAALGYGVWLARR
jgi:hypothetical protein